MYFLLSYLISSIIISIITYKFKFRYDKLPKLKIKKFGIVFTSFKRHKIKIGKAKVVQAGNLTYLKQGNELVVITNITGVLIKNEHMFFCANGEVKIIFNCNKFYRYFNVNIKSKYFCLDILKQAALIEIINNLFNIKNCKRLKKYIFFIKNILKIKINNKKIEIKSNKFKFSYILFYKLNNKIKRININETL